VSGLVASSFFDFFKVFFAILFSYALFALWGIAFLMCNAVAKHRLDLLRHASASLSYIYMQYQDRVGPGLPIPSIEKVNEC
jgi:hypothetical protein